MYSDILLLSFVLIFATLGYSQGFAFQFISLLAWITSIFFSQDIVHLIQRNSANIFFTKIPSLVLWVFVVMGIFIFAALVKLVFKRVKKAPMINPLDRWLGLVLGVAKGALIAALISLAFNLIPERVQSPSVAQDFSDSRLVHAGSNLLNWKSFEILKTVQREIQKFEKYQLEEGTPWDFESNEDSY